MGYMSNETGIDVDKLAVGGPGLSFIGIIKLVFCFKILLT